MYKDLSNAHLYGLSIVQYNAIEVPVSNKQLLEYYDDWAGKLLEFTNQTIQFESNIESNFPIYRNLKYSGLNSFIMRATLLEQRKPYDDHLKAIPFRFNLGGRIIEYYNPSDLYMYDRGTEDQFEKDLFQQFAGGKNVFKYLRESNSEKVSNAIRKSGKHYKGNQKAKKEFSSELKLKLSNFNHDSSDAILSSNSSSSSSASKDAGIGYGLMQNRIVRHMERHGLTDKDVALMAKLILLGYEPINPFAKKCAKDYMEENGLDFVSAVRRTQPAYFPFLNKMPITLPLLLASWFIAETARNPLSFYISIMLLDLLEVEARLPNGEKITWKNTIFHPEYFNNDSLNKARKNELCKLGGLHPMAHLGSFTEFKKNRHQRDSPLTLSNIKSSIIIMLWLKNCSLQKKNISLHGIKSFLEKGNSPKVIDSKKLTNMLKFSTLEGYSEQQLCQQPNAAAKLLKDFRMLPSPVNKINCITDIDFKKFNDESPIKSTQLLKKKEAAGKDKKILTLCEMSLQKCRQLWQTQTTAKEKRTLPYKGTRVKLVQSYRFFIWDTKNVSRRELITHREVSEREWQAIQINRAAVKAQNHEDEDFAASPPISLIESIRNY